MTQEEKDLFFRDLSWRLPYGVMLNVKGQDGPSLYDFNEPLWSLWIEDGKFSINDRGEGDYEGICEIRPYLRPISDMTLEERKEYGEIPPGVVFEDLVRMPNINRMKWLLRNQFDIQGLIEKKLAINCTNLGIYEKYR